MTIKTIVTHPGSAHKDDFLACSLMIHLHGVAVERRDPTPEDLSDAAVCVIDVGLEHDVDKMNFDHHQFPRDTPPTCALSLVLMHMGLYEDAKSFCDWLEPAEYFDTRGAGGTAAWLGIDRDIVSKLNSPIDITALRRFAQQTRLEPGNVIWELMRMIGEDLVSYLTGLRSRMNLIGDISETWDVGNGQEILFLERCDALGDDPSFGIFQFLTEQGRDDQVIGLVYPDRRGAGYGLSRFKDHQGLDFTRIENEADVHFAHSRGFVAKTSADQAERLRELIKLAQV